MRHKPVVLASALLATLTFGGCDSGTAPDGIEGTFVAAPFRFDSVRLSIESGPGGVLSGSGTVVNDVGQGARFLVAGRYPEVTFEVTTSEPGVVYWNNARFRGAYQTPDEIAGFLTFQVDQAVSVTFRRLEP